MIPCGKNDAFNTFSAPDSPRRREGAPLRGTGGDTHGPIQRVGLVVRVICISWYVVSKITFGRGLKKIMHEEKYERFHIENRNFSCCGKAELFTLR